jgi:putative methionine-R-sulfoxide reductase with GAF domain
MDQGTLSATDPFPATRRERRRRARQRPHSPVYASFKSPQAGLVLDLSELLDLNEDGFAVHTAEPLEANRSLALTLDLPETGAYIHGHGVAIWSDASGRAGVRFADLSDTALRLLKEWLFANLLVACANHAARTEQRTHQAESEPPGLPVAAAAPKPANAALSRMDAVREKVLASADDPAAALNLIAGCAREWTGARGAALALRSGEEMICRARSGEMAPPLGAAVDVSHGLSGECVRSGQMVSADDTENDARVDRETCRVLGICSILAAPILADSRVVGLLEVFSPRAHAFKKEHAAVLNQLAETVPTKPAMPPRETVATSALPAQEAAVQSQLPAKATRAWKLPRNLYFALMALVAIGATTAGYLLAPTIQSHWFAAGSEATAAAAAPQTRPTAATSPEELQRLAASGDAESQYWLGIRYSTGANGVQNDVEAAKWFRLAAEQGHVQAQALLGSWYWSGRGVPKDLSKAYLWASLAWAQGDENSKMRLEGLRSQMTRSQVLAASQQADAWLRQHSQTSNPAKN